MGIPQSVTGTLTVDNGFVGSLGDGLYVTLSGDPGDTCAFFLRDLTGEASGYQTLSGGGQYAYACSLGGIVVAFLWDEYGFTWYKFTATTSPRGWDVAAFTTSGPSPLESERYLPTAAFISGDLTTVVATDGTTVYGLRLDGDGTPEWSCSLGDGFLVGAPSGDRWLREDSDGLHVRRFDSTGSEDTSATNFTHPDPYGWNFDDTSRSTLMWVQTAGTYYNVRSIYIWIEDDGYGPITVHWGEVRQGAEGLYVTDSFTPFEPGWDHGSVTSRIYPVASLWEDQIAIGFYRYEIS